MARRKNRNEKAATDLEQEKMRPAGQAASAASEAAPVVESDGGAAADLDEKQHALEPDGTGGKTGSAGGSAPVAEPARHGIDDSDVPFGRHGDSVGEYGRNSEPLADSKGAIDGQQATDNSAGDPAGGDLASGDDGDGAGSDRAGADPQEGVDSGLHGAPDLDGDHGAADAGTLAGAIFAYNGPELKLDPDGGAGFNALESYYSGDGLIKPGDIVRWSVPEGEKLQFRDDREFVVVRSAEDICEIDAVNFASRAGQVVASEIFMLLAGAAPLEAVIWYRGGRIGDMPQLAKGDVDQVEHEISVLATYVCDHGGNDGERLRNYATVLKWIEASPWADVVLPEKMAWILFAANCHSVYQAIRDRQSVVEHERAMAAMPANPPIALEDSIFEEETSLGEMIPGVLEGLAEAESQKASQQTEDASRLAGSEDDQAATTLRELGVPTIAETLLNTDQEGL